MFATVKIRFSSTIPYKYEIINLINHETGFIYDLGNELHKKYNKYKYKPLNSFAGHTECYTLDLPIEEIQNIPKTESDFIQYNDLITEEDIENVIRERNRRIIIEKLTIYKN